ncbi:hypothetical protein CSQ92_11090 [Janthinobacterium sp. BJB446]|uniref:DUF262 domain-containing protein n=1 Tax=Janthinobacterium sp. BJB446 TaxID=2048009 RepID=UPI000C0CEC73|nr:DUF262 domain-containing protein [Janthinobacterium sp. BJB446]PHV23486.1 hypothetical protein CSQ92_11090 [Janthinobacterium sp. BJB446]
MTNIHSKKDQDLVDELIEDLDEEILADVRIQESLAPLVVASRDWTVETIIRQISQKNIDLNPKFQRRNAWDDGKRSALIESLIWGVPVPQIVLAEDPNRPRAYIVIDGKQRLLTIAGFMDPTINYWDKAVVKGLTVFDDLNGCSAQDLASNDDLSDYYRRLMNADIRCTVLSNYSNPDVLYDIFYRINTGSVRLGSQELRQVFHRGWFADYLVEITNTPQPIHKVLGLDEPDVRLADVEIVLRSLAMDLFGVRYKGNLKQFLAFAMQSITNDLDRQSIEQEYMKFNFGISNCAHLFDYNEIGRKITNGKFETRFNRVLFEVEIFFLKGLTEANIKRNKAKFLKAFDGLMNDKEFRSSIESTTKSVENTRIRFSKFQDLVRRVFSKTIDLPF